MANLTLPIFGVHSPINFRPYGVCCNKDGRFLVSTEDGCIHVLDHSGKFLGIAVTSSEDGFGTFTNVVQDEGVLWCSYSRNGIVKNCKLFSYKNNLNDNHAH